MFIDNNMLYLVYHLVFRSVIGIPTELIEGIDIRGEISHGEKHNFRIPESPLAPNTRYEILISYVDSASFFLSWDCSSHRKASMRPLDTDKLLFNTDELGRISRNTCKTIALKMTRNLKQGNSPIPYWILLENTTSPKNPCYVPVSIILVLFAIIIWKWIQQK